jgi:hypothetical protein
MQSPKNSTSGSQDASTTARLVNRLCTPGGLRAAPDRSYLQAFVEGMSSLDGTEVAKLLEEKLVSECMCMRSTLEAFQGSVVALSTDMVPRCGWQ